MTHTDIISSPINAIAQSQQSEFPAGGKNIRTHIVTVKSIVVLIEEYIYICKYICMAYVLLL